MLNCHEKYNKITKEITMKKHSSLAQQVQQAQRTFDSWTAAHKSSVHLEGSSGALTRVPPLHTGVVNQQIKAHGSEK